VRLRTSNGSVRRSQADDLSGAEAKNLPLVRFQNFKANPIEFDHFTGSRHVAGDSVEKSGDGGCIRVLGSRVELNAKKLADLIEGNAAAQHHGPARLTDHIGRRAAIFFPNFAHDFLDEVLHRDDACHQSIFVNHDTHLLVLPLHFLQQFRAELRLGNE
jgi:hypothetical protein